MGLEREAHLVLIPAALRSSVVLETQGQLEYPALAVVEAVAALVVLVLVEPLRAISVVLELPAR